MRIANRPATIVKPDVRLSAQANARAFYHVRSYLYLLLSLDRYISM